VKAADFFSGDYGRARDRFREAARKLGVPVESHAIAATGPRDESLAIDAATIGPTSARRVLILSSGLHGVEGFLGSAAQLAWLAQVDASCLPEQLKIVLIHALNPFGFAWLRRSNERNVDLNRNFVPGEELFSSAEYQDALAVYERFSSFLNPASPPSRWDAYRLRALGAILSVGLSARNNLPHEEQPSILALKALGKLGITQLQKTLLVGQYKYQNGLFYGGERPEESTAWMQRHLPVWIDSVDLTLHIDFHSGLGAWGDYRLFIPDRRGSPRARWVGERFGDDVVVPTDEQIAYAANGRMADYFRDLNVGGSYHCLTAEFGTYAGIRLLGALRAENRAHFYADRDSPAYRRAKHKLIEAFAPASIRWRETVVAKSLALIARVIEVCGKCDP
jgi:hypothetical protein